MAETTNFCVEVMNSKRLTIEGKTWSRGTNSRLLCPVNVTFNLCNKVLINYHNTDFRVPSEYLLNVFALKIFFFLLSYRRRIQNICCRLIR